MTGILAGRLCVFGVLAGGWLLVAAGVRGLTRPDVLRAALFSHRLIPPRLLSRAVVTTYERGIIALGVVAELAAVLGRPAAAAAALAPLYAGFACYLLLILRLRGGVPCGCLGDAKAVRVRTVLRTLLVVAAALGTLVLRPDLAVADRILLVTVAAIVPVAILANPLRVAVDTLGG